MATRSTVDVYPGGVDWVTKLRRKVLPTVHRIKQPLGGFAICTVDPTEYVGTVERELETFRTDLESMSFTTEPVASLKVREDGQPSAGSWVRRQSRLADRQLHVALFQAGTESIEVFAHEEYSWRRHPYKHYTFQGYDPCSGVERVRELFENYDLTYSLERY